MSAPMFSGYLGENIRKNSENIMQLFRNLPESDQLYDQEAEE